MNLLLGVAPPSSSFVTIAVPIPHWDVTSDYHSTGNQFERFRGVLELISRFEFEFCRRENYFFLNDSNFWSVHVTMPWPVCAHAIPLRMLWLP